MYYSLQPYCALVEGAYRGAIYNFQTGKVYSISNSTVKLLKQCQENTNEDIYVPKDPKQLDFLDQLTKLGLGSYYVKKENIGTFSCKKLDAPKLEFLWLELTSNCNNRCLHCYSTSSPYCQDKNKVSHDRWLNLIEEAGAAGANAIQLIGGEPLLYPKWQELVIKAQKYQFNFIEIFTNATLLTKSHITFIKNHNVQIATTIYADNAATHDKITQNPGSFNKTLSSIKTMLDAKIPVRIASVIMKDNEHEVENIMSLLEKLGVEVNPPDVVRPTGRGNDTDLMPQNYTKLPIKPPFHTNEKDFSIMHQFHSCLAGKLAVTSDGDVIPCIFARNQVCGNILDSSLQDILTSTPLQHCWHSTKDLIEKCKDCEYRYACTDCRPLAQGTDPDKKWLACSVGCKYNPYIGKWAHE